MQTEMGVWAGGEVPLFVYITVVILGVLLAANCVFMVVVCVKASRRGSAGKLGAARGMHSLPTTRAGRALEQWAT